MRILSFLIDKHNPIVTAARDAATALSHAAAPTAHAMLDGIHRSNLPFCAYGAVACTLGVMALLAWRESKSESARDHALHACASLTLAVAHLFNLN